MLSTLLGHIILTIYRTFYLKCTLISSILKLSVIHNLKTSQRFNISYLMTNQLRTLHAQL